MFTLGIILCKNMYSNYLYKKYYRGLGIETVFANVIKAYSDPGNLVIVLGTTDYDESYFIDLLKSYGTNILPRVVNSECPSNERYILYFLKLFECVFNGTYKILQGNNVFGRWSAVYIRSHLGGGSIKK